MASIDVPAIGEAKGEEKSRNEDQIVAPVEEAKLETA